MGIIKGILYFVLSYIQSSFNFIAGKLILITLAVGIGAYFYNDSPSLAYALLGFSFALFVLKKSYDILLSMLRPDISDIKK